MVSILLTIYSFSWPTHISLSFLRMLCYYCVLDGPKSVKFSQDANLLFFPPMSFNCAGLELPGSTLNDSMSASTGFSRDSRVLERLSLSIYDAFMQIFKGPLWVDELYRGCLSL